MNECFEKARLFPLVILCVLVIIQCSSDPLAPFEPEISNAPDSFQLQATGVRNRTATLVYSWNNTGTRATVDHSTTTTAGSARLVIEDARGAKVYEETLVPSLNDTTTTGVPGVWKIRMVLYRYSGTLNFRAQKL